MLRDMLTMTRLTAAGWLLAASGVGVLGTVLMGASQLPARASESNDIADQFGVEIVWTDDNCGAALSDHHKGGCFLALTPDVIYVSPGLEPEAERYMILHEIGHVLQHRLGTPIDECKADQFAESMGATTGSNCP